MKITFNNPKTGDGFQKEVEKEKESQLQGKRIGDAFEGALVGLPEGYKLKITGGTDTAGFPMRADIPGSHRKKALLSGGTGTKYLRKGLKLKKTVTGNIISKTTAQINAVITEFGAKTLEESGFAAKKPARKTGKKKEEKKAEEAA